MAIASDVYKVCVCMYVCMYVCKYCVDSSRVSVTVQSSAGAIQSTVKTLVQSCALEVRQSPCHTVMSHSHNITQSSCHTVTMSHSHNVTRSPCHTWSQAVHLSPHGLLILFLCPSPPFSHLLWTQTRVHRGSCSQTAICHLKQKVT